MSDARHGRQTVLLVATEGGPPAQLAVDESPDDIVRQIRSGVADKFLWLRQPLGSDGDVFIRPDAIIAAWDQQVELVNDPRAFGVQQTRGGIHLPPKAN